MRGKRVKEGPFIGSGRLIPAHAGKTKEREGPRVAPTAHPRACGENPSGAEKPLPLWGSSPRMRGKPSPSKLMRQFGGLIPAHAGKTIRVLMGLSPNWAHPRACGENRLGLRGRGSILGSSPRMRGKPAEADYVELLGGLIPAHAGKTPPCGTGS